MYKRARLGIGYLPQERSDFRRLTVWQNLMAILETLNISRAERNRRAEHLLDQYGLIEVQEPARRHALRRRAPQAGNRPRARHRAQADPARRAVQRRRPDRRRRPPAEVRRLRDEFGKSVLITDHNVPQTLKVCDRALIINEGRVFAEGTPREIINDPRRAQCLSRQHVPRRRVRRHQLAEPRAGPPGDPDAGVTGFRSTPRHDPLKPFGSLSHPTYRRAMICRCARPSTFGACTRAPFTEQFNANVFSTRARCRCGGCQLSLVADAPCGGAGRAGRAEQPAGDDAKGLKKEAEASVEVTDAAKPVVDKLRDAYAKLGGLQTAGTWSANWDIDGDQGKESAAFTSSFAAPNKFRHEIKDDLLFGSTGEKAYGLRKNQYFTEDAPKANVAVAELPKTRAAVEGEGPVAAAGGGAVDAVPCGRCDEDRQGRRREDRPGVVHFAEGNDEEGRTSPCCSIRRRAWCGSGRST